MTGSRRPKRASVSQKRQKALSESSALGRIRRKNWRIMKKTSISKATLGIKADMRSEYNFDYRKAKPNRFAARQLDRDVSEVFPTPDSVSKVLRPLIEAMPSKPKRRKVSA
jgi:hypothetical protein